jgi:hypothetical protein
LLVSWCAGGRCDMVGNDEDLCRSRRPSVEDRDGQAQVEYSVAVRSGGRVAPCVVYTVHEETRSVGFLVEPQNQDLRFVSGLASKPLARFLPVWSQNQWRRFSGLDLKIGSSGLVIWFSKSPRWFLSLGFKTKRTSICRLHHKINRGRSAWGTHQNLAACFAWKQVTLGFLSLASRLLEAQ